MVAHAMVSSSFTLGINFAGLLLSTIFGDDEGKLSIPKPSKNENPYKLVPKKIAAFFPLSLPSIALQFSRAPSGDLVETLQIIGGQTTKLPGIQKDVWIISHPNFVTIGTLLSMDNVERIDPPFDHVSRRSLEVLPRILLSIYQVVRLLRIICDNRNPDIMENKIQWYTDEDDWTNDEKEDGEEGGDEKLETLPKEFNHRFKYSKVGEDLADEQIFYDINFPYPKASEGMVVPFVENCAASDVNALNQFVRRFWNICFSDHDDATRMYDEWMAAWSREIMNTTFGKWMAHWIVCIEIATQVGGHVVFLKSSDNNYLGAIIFGKFSIKLSQGEDWIKTVDGVELERDLGFFATHSQAVKDIIRTVGLEGSDLVNMVEIKTMRHLGSIIREHGSLNPNNRNILSALLPKVTFSERPTPITAESIIDTITHLANKTELDNSVFMDASAILSDDLTTRTLARFGSTVPSFGYSGPEAVRVCEILGKGVSDDIAYGRSAPQNLQSKKVSLRGAVAQWNTMMNTGLIRTDITKRLKDTRVFPRREAEEIWSAMNREIAKTIERKGEVAASKRGRTEGDGGSGPEKKRVRVIDLL